MIAFLQENKLLLTVYIPLAVVVFVVISVCAVVLLAANNQEVKDKLKEKMDLYDPDAQDSGDKKVDAAVKVWDGIQKTVSGGGVTRVNILIRI